MQAVRASNRPAFASLAGGRADVPAMCSKPLLQMKAAAAPAPACAPIRMSAVEALNRVRLGSLFACVCAWLLPLLA